MNRYMLFLGQTYYAAGGGYDFHTSYTTLEEALDIGHTYTDDGNLADWFHIFDTELGKVLDLDEDEHINYGGGHC